MHPRPASPHCFPHMRVLLAGEVENSGRCARSIPQAPVRLLFWALEVSDKVGVIDALIDKADTIIIGGGMCFSPSCLLRVTRLASLREEDWVERAGEMLYRRLKSVGEDAAADRWLLPDEFAEDANTATCAADAMPSDMMGLDIGPRKPGRLCCRYR